MPRCVHSMTDVGHPALSLSTTHSSAARKTRYQAWQKEQRCFLSFFCFKFVEGKSEEVFQQCYWLPLLWKVAYKKLYIYILYNIYIFKKNLVRFFSLPSSFFPFYFSLLLLTPNSQHNTCNTYTYNTKSTVPNGHDRKCYVDGRHPLSAYQPSTLSIPPSW